MYALFQKLSDRDKGLVLIVMGSILLLHTLGIIQTGLNYIIIGGAAYIMWCGFLKMNGPKKIQALLKRERIEYKEEQ